MGCLFTLWAPLIFRKSVRFSSFPLHSAFRIELCIQHLQQLLQSKINKITFFPFIFEQKLFFYYFYVIRDLGALMITTLKFIQIQALKDG